MPLFQGEHPVCNPCGHSQIPVKWKHHAKTLFVRWRHASTLISHPINIIKTSVKFSDFVKLSSPGKKHESTSIDENPKHFDMI